MGNVPTMSAPGWSLPPAVRAVTGPRPVAVPAVFAVVTGLAVSLAGIRGADYPAHFLRAELWERAGASVWNNYWYGGHPTPSYSVLVPPMAAAIGAVALCVVASIVATYCFARLLHSLVPDSPPLARTLAGLSFALCSTVNVIVGRAPFAVGLAIALIAVLAWRARHVAVAVLFALITPFASPVVATFVAIAAASVGLDALWQRCRSVPRRRRLIEASIVLGVSIVPLLAMGALFRDSGHFPFRGDQLFFSVLVMGVAALTFRHRIVRFASGMAAVASLLLFVVPNPLGGNFLRFTQFFVVPVAIVGVGAVRRNWAPLLWLMVGGLVAGAAIWSVQYGVVAVVQWAGDDSVEADYHQPLIDQVLARNADGKPLGRVEIPFTDNHWESYFVASEVPYARGWERQLDLERNAELYDPELTRAEYHDWLHHNGVRWVALADVDLDQGGQPESDILAMWRDIEWLDLVWSNENWRLFEVADYLPIVDRPAELVSQTPDELVLRTAEAAVVTLRYGYSDSLSIDGEACLIPHEHDGWMTVYLPAAGTYSLAANAGGLIPGVDADTCRARVEQAGALAVAG